MYIVYNIYFIRYTLNYMLYTLYYIVFIIKYTIYTIYYMLYTIYLDILYTIYYIYYIYRIYFPYNIYWYSLEPLVYLREKESAPWRWHIGTWLHLQNRRGAGRYIWIIIIIYISTLIQVCTIKTASLLHFTA